MRWFANKGWLVTPVFLVALLGERAASADGSCLPSTEVAAYGAVCVLVWSQESNGEDHRYECENPFHCPSYGITHSFYDGGIYVCTDGGTLSDACERYIDDGCVPNTGCHTDDPDCPLLDRDGNCCWGALDYDYQCCYGTVGEMGMCIPDTRTPIDPPNKGQ